MIVTLAAILLQTSSTMPTSTLIFGIGSSTCREWTQRKKTHDRVTDKQWLAGFLTGVEFINTGFGAKPLILDSDDPEILIGFVDDYCLEHPLNAISDGAQFLWLELFKRSQR